MEKFKPAKKSKQDKPWLKIGLRLTDKEKAHIEAAAAHRGVSLCEFCKQAVMYAIDNIEEK